MVNKLWLPWLRFREQSFRGIDGSAEEEAAAAIAATPSRDLSLHAGQTIKVNISGLVSGIFLDVHHR